MLANDPTSPLRSAGYSWQRLFRVVHDSRLRDWAWTLGIPELGGTYLQSHNVRLVSELVSSLGYGSASSSGVLLVGPEPEVLSDVLSDLGVAVKAESDPRRIVEFGDDSEEVVVYLRSEAPNSTDPERALLENLRRVARRVVLISGPRLVEAERFFSTRGDRISTFADDQVMLASKPGSLESNGLNRPTPNGPGAEVTNLLDVCLAQVAALGESGRRPRCGTRRSRRYAASGRSRRSGNRRDVLVAGGCAQRTCRGAARSRRDHATLPNGPPIAYLAGARRRLQGDAWCPCAEAKGCATAPGPAPKRRCLNPGGASIRSDLGLLPESRRGGAGRRCVVARRALRFGPWSAPWS